MQFQLTLVRHGETDANKNRIVQSFSNHGLNDTGKEQSALLGRYFKANHARFTKYIASGLLRTHETLDEITKELCSGGKVRYSKDARLNEKNFGEALEGKPGAEYIAAVIASGDPVRYVAEGGETYESVRARVESFFKELCQEIFECQSLVEDHVLVVSSGAWMAHFLDYFDTEPGFEFVDADGKKPNKMLYCKPFKNTAFTQLQILKENESSWKVTLLKLHQTSHLES